MKMKNLFTILVVAVFVMLAYCFTFANKRQINARVLRIEKVEEVKKTDSSIMTDVYYLVFTNKGAFRVNIRGLLARPRLAGTIKKDSLYRFELVGVEIPFLGVYSSVLEVSK